MEKLTTNRTIVVEGRYDAVKVNAVVDANIIVIDGFAIYSDKAKQNLLKRLAAQNGLILLLDADGAGFRMRHYITGLVGERNVLQLYTPAVKGKEKRKETAGKEGLLGVEGIDAQVLHQMFTKALAQDAQNSAGKPAQADTPPASTTPDAQPASMANTTPAQGGGTPVRDEPRKVNYTDLFRWGLSGTEGSAARKTAFLQALGLPPRLSKKELVNVLNRLYTYQELEEKLQELFGE